MFGFFKKQFTVNDFILEIKKIYNSDENNDECHRKVYDYCNELNTRDLNIHYHKQLFQCLSFMESAKLRDELTDFDIQRNILIIQGICMDTAD